MNAPEDTIPRWNLDKIYGGFHDPAYNEARESTASSIRLFGRASEEGPKEKERAEEWLSRCLDLLNSLAARLENLESYVLCRYTTATTDKEAVREMNRLEELSTPLAAARAAFRESLGNLGKTAEELCSSPALKDYLFFITEELEFRKHQMETSEEDLAADLARSGANAWGRLQDTLGSTESITWNEKTGEKKTVVQLRALAYDPEREVREKAYRKELEIWKRVEIPLSFALNGVKGHSIVVNRRRGYTATLQRSIKQNRVTEKTLDSLLQVMHESLPVFRNYLKTKAHILAVPRLAFFDLFAPVGESNAVWDFKGTRDFILRQFYSFSKDYGSFGEKAFTEGWIDSEPRQGKVGGAYCTSFSEPWESRILSNFDHSFNSVTTLAHELGHAYHHHCLRGAAFLLRDYPMTLAETASIFSENIVYGRLLADLQGKERLPVLESFLQDSCQVIVDILSRFLFEKAVFEEREKGDLSPEDYCDLMIKAQKETYGDGLDPELLHPYMWAVKSHYYSHALAFYNFPYAFGLLFGLGLYGLYLETGAAFTDRYIAILAGTGKASAVDLAAQAGFNIEEPDFWRRGLEVITRRAEEFQAAARG
ncbi:MAG: M3 family oligoendopeptidase [Spirochaetales bacterium]|nr:M3 family oligoendopeptidase [Spirochaetales bacterium]